MCIAHWVLQDFSEIFYRPITHILYLYWLYWLIIKNINNKILNEEKQYWKQKTKKKHTNKSFCKYMDYYTKNLCSLATKNFFLLPRVWSNFAGFSISATWACFFSFVKCVFSASSAVKVRLLTTAHTHWSCSFWHMKTSFKWIT